MSLKEEDSAAPEIHLPADIDWKMLDKSKFFLLGAGLFSGVSAALYPAVVLKTRQQVSPEQLPCARAAVAVLHSEGLRGLYRGFGTSLTGTIPARALYMGALEVTKSSVGTATVRAGVPEPAAAAVASAAAGLSAAVAAQLVWTPVDLISQRLMVQGGGSVPAGGRYANGIDAFRKIVRSDGLRGLYRGFGMSILTYAPSNAVWWASYSVAQRAVWAGVGWLRPPCRKEEFWQGAGYRPDSKTVAAVQGLSAAVAGGVSAVITMPLDTIKTRLQVLEGEGRPTIVQTARNLVREGGWAACYRGLGPRWASMSMSATTMITTYEFLKRLSAKNHNSVA